MASLSREGKVWRIQFYSDGKRCTLRLPAGLAKRDAHSVQTYVERIIACKLAGVPLPQDVAGWLGAVGPELYGRLAALGLVPPRQSMTLSEFLTDWLRERRHDKPSSLAAYRHVVADLRRCFGDSLPLGSLTVESGRRLLEHLRARGYRPTTIGKRLSCARTILNRAVELELLTRNPLSSVKAPPANPAERKVYVPAELILKALEFCPDVWWRLLLVLARFQGLRTPSECVTLKWEHVLWSESKLVVPVPKLQHIPGREFRVMPLFERTRQCLAEAFELAAEGDEFIFPERWRRSAWGVNGWKNCNMRTGFQRILLRAGIKPWPRLFHSLRGSCESDLASRFPIATAASWIGNSVAVAARHYVSPLDAHFQDAITNDPWKADAKSDAMVTRNPTPQVAAQCGAESQV